MSCRRLDILNSCELRPVLISAAVCLCLWAAGCTWKREPGEYHADSTGRSFGEQTAAPAADIVGAANTDERERQEPGEPQPTLAGTTVVLRDLSQYVPLQWNVHPDRLPKTSSRPEDFDLDELLKYRGPSFEQDRIENGMAYAIDASTEANYHAIDILLSSLQVPFLIYVPGCRFGGNWRDDRHGLMIVIVQRDDYREAAKLLQTAVAKGILETGPLEKP